MNHNEREAPRLLLAANGSGDFSRNHVRYVVTSSDPTDLAADWTCGNSVYSQWDLHWLLRGFWVKYFVFKIFGKCRSKEGPAPFHSVLNHSFLWSSTAFFLIATGASVILRRTACHLVMFGYVLVLRPLSILPLPVTHRSLCPGSPEARVFPSHPLMVLPLQFHVDHEEH